MITVITQTTGERNQETKEVFESIRPYLEQGYTYRDAVKAVGRIGENSNPNIRVSWFKHLIDYGTSRGYPHTYKKLGRRKNGHK